MKRKAGIARGPVGLLDQHSVKTVDCDLRLTIAETEKLSHMGLRWIKIIGNEVIVSYYRIIIFHTP